METTLGVSKSTLKRLKKLGRFTEGYDGLLRRMLDYVEENEEDFNQATIEEDMDNEEEE